MPNPKIQLGADGEFDTDLPVHPMGITDTKNSHIAWQIFKTLVIAASVPVGAFLHLLLGGIMIFVITGRVYYGAECTVEMNLNGGAYVDERIYDTKGEQVCTPIDDELRSRPVASPDEQHIALVSNYNWGDHRKNRSSVVFLANQDGEELLVVDPANEIIGSRSMLNVSWVDDTTMAFEYSYNDPICHYHINGTFIECFGQGN